MPWVFIYKMSTNGPETEDDQISTKLRAITDCTARIDGVKVALSFADNQDLKTQLCHKLALAYNERGFVRYQKVDFDDAIDDYTQAVQYDDRLHVSYYNRGLVHYRLGRFGAAIEDMKKSLSIQKDFEPAMQCLEQAEIDRLGDKQRQPEPS